LSYQYNKKWGGRHVENLSLTQLSMVAVLRDDGGIQSDQTNLSGKIYKVMMEYQRIRYFKSFRHDVWKMNLQNEFFCEMPSGFISR